MGDQEEVEVEVEADWIEQVVNKKQQVLAEEEAVAEAVELMVQMSWTILMELVVDAVEEQLALLLVVVVKMMVGVKEEVVVLKER